MPAPTKNRRTTAKKVQVRTGKVEVVEEEVKRDIHEKAAQKATPAKRTYTRQTVPSAETGRPETGREFAARMRNHFKLKGPRELMEGASTTREPPMAQQAPGDVMEFPDDLPTITPPSLVEVVNSASGLDLMEIVRNRYDRDTFFEVILRNPKDYRNFRVEAGYIYQQDENRRALCIPKIVVDGRNIREMVIDEAHSVLAHLGARKTIAYLRDHVWWK
ncbi:hypothetical protein FA13DRAFT_1648782, partial [Coprinellus micaceus]